MKGWHGKEGPKMFGSKDSSRWRRKNQEEFWDVKREMMRMLGGYGLFGIKVGNEDVRKTLSLMAEGHSQDRAIARVLGDLRGFSRSRGR